TASGGVANFAATKIAVNIDPFENDLRGGYFFAGLNGNSLVVSFTNNHPPAADTVVAYRTGDALTIPIAALAAHWSDPDNDPVALLDVATVSTNGADVSSDGTFIYC